MGEVLRVWDHTSKSVCVLHILVCGSGGKSSWTNPPFMFSGNFLLGTLILSSSCFSTEVILCLCCKSLLSWLSTSTGGNRKRFKDERHNNTTDNKESAEMLISSSLCHVRDQLQYPPFCQSWHVLLLYCVEYRNLKWHIWLSCSLFNLCFPFSSSQIQQTPKNLLSSSCMCWGQRCSRLNRTLQIEFTLDETNRFACAYPPETQWPAPGNEPSHLQTV